MNLQHNKLTQLPAEIGNLSNLTEWWLNNNKLTQLPAEIGKLSNLTKWWLNDNQLTQLPAEIGNLTNLTWLDVEDNFFSHDEEVRISKLLPRCQIIYYPDDDYDDYHRNKYGPHLSYEDWLNDEFGDDAEAAYWNLD